MNGRLEALDVSKTYQRGAVVVPAVKSASLAVDKGQIVLVMGPSGSGKTTLLSILGCILRPTSGSIYLDGRAISELPESRLPAIRRSCFGLVFQTFHLFPFLTALENVEVAMRLQKVSRSVSKPRAMDLLVRCGLEQRATFYPEDLSGGEKQRVAFARALAGNPQFVLADEPTANLDSATGEEVFSMLRQCAKELNKGVVMVTHDPKAQGFADRVFSMTDGRIGALS
jgi:putative ABC transport system ATP-binding protein